MHISTSINQNLTKGNLSEPEFYYNLLLKARNKLQKEQEEKKTEAVLSKGFSKTKLQLLK